MTWNSLDQDGLELRDLPVSASPVLEVKAGITLPLISVIVVVYSVCLGVLPACVSVRHLPAW